MSVHATRSTPRIVSRLLPTARSTGEHARSRARTRAATGPRPRCWCATASPRDGPPQPRGPRTCAATRARLGGSLAYSSARETAWTRAAGRPVEQPESRRGSDAAGSPSTSTRHRAHREPARARVCREHELEACGSARSRSSVQHESPLSGWRSVSSTLGANPVPRRAAGPRGAHVRRSGRGTPSRRPDRRRGRGGQWILERWGTEAVVRVEALARRHLP